MISNTVTLFRMSFVIPLFWLLGANGPSWAALALFLGAGVLDVIDGKIARHLGESSELGGMLDLVADRLLTLSAVVGLIASGTLSMVAIGASMVLAVRCVFVASFGEALKGRADLASSGLEPVKIVLSFLGLGLAMSPLQDQHILGVAVRDVASVCLVAAAGLTIVTVVGYLSTTIKALATDRDAGVH